MPAEPSAVLEAFASADDPVQAEAGALRFGLSAVTGLSPNPPVLEFPLHFEPNAVPATFAGVGVKSSKVGSTRDCPGRIRWAAGTLRCFELRFGVSGSAGGVRLFGLVRAHLAVGVRVWCGGGGTKVVMSSREPVVT